MATVTIRPNGDSATHDGTWAITSPPGGSNAYAAIDEAVADDTDYISNNDTTSTFDKQAVTLEDMPAASAISSVVMKWRSRCAFSTLSTTPFIRVSGSDTEKASPQVVTTTDAEYSWDITGEQSWTDALINGLEIGWRKNATANNTLRVTQAWVEITYTASGGTSVTPAAATVAATAVAPTVVLGSSSVTPAAATVVASAIAPTVVQGSLSITPAAATVAATAIAPTVALGSTSVTPAVASVAATAVAPTVVQASLSITPAVATMTMTAIAPTVEIETPGGSVEVTPDAAVMVATAVAPTVVLGSLTITPAVASMVATAVAPTVVLGSVAMTPAVAVITMAAIAPTVVLGSVAMTPAVAAIIATAVAPSVILGSLSVTPGAATVVMVAIAPTVINSGEVVAIVLPLSSTIAGSRPTSTLTTP